MFMIKNSYISHCGKKPPAAHCAQGTLKIMPNFQAWSECVYVHVIGGMFQAWKLGMILRVPCGHPLFFLGCPIAKILKIRVPHYFFFLFC